VQIGAVIKECISVNGVKVGSTITPFPVFLYNNTIKKNNTCRFQVYNNSASSNPNQLRIASDNTGWNNDKFYCTIQYTKN
jgi:hypothetical protein